MKKHPNIIGVSGRIGSGKDAVGSIVLNLTAKELYGYLNYTWEIKKWAGKLKTIASLLTGIPEFKFEDQEFKKTNLGSEWSSIVRKAGKRQDGLFGTGEMEIKPMTVRDFLQKLGTDALRDNLHPNTWVNALMADHIGTYDIDTDCVTYPNWIITDTRFPNEAEAIKQAGGFIIRVNRKTDVEEQLHPSETALDDYTFDYEIDNNGSMKDLIVAVRAILKKENILDI
jgi:hypothetical protein